MNNKRICEKIVILSYNLTLPNIIKYHSEEVATPLMKVHHHCERFCIPLNCWFPTHMYRYSLGQFSAQVEIYQYPQVCSYISRFLDIFTTAEQEQPRYFV